MGDKERIYDEQIAPLLAQAGKIAEANGMPIVAQVEYLPGEFGLTACLPESTGYAMTMLYWAARSKRNFDAFMFAVMRHARERGHTSSVLAILFRALGESDRVTPAAPRKAEG